MVAVKKGNTRTSAVNQCPYSVVHALSSRDYSMLLHTNYIAYGQTCCTHVKREAGGEFPFT